MLFMNILDKIKKILPTRACSSEGFAVREFLVVLSIICTFSVIGSMGLMEFKKKACNIIVRYDLKKFFEAEQMFYGQHDTYKGSIGDVISNDPKVLSTFVLEGFSPSLNTSIIVTDDDPFTAVGRNEGFKLTFACNINTHTIAERQ